MQKNGQQPEGRKEGYVKGGEAIVIHRRQRKNTRRGGAAGAYQGTFFSLLDAQKFIRKICFKKRRKKHQTRIRLEKNPWCGLGNIEDIQGEMAA